MRYIIMGNPIPLARARLSLHGKKHFYDSQAEAKLIAAIQVQSQHGDKPQYQGPLSLDVVFYLPLARCMSVKKMHLYENKPHDLRPDTSNLLKFLEDTLNKILYHDDSQIAIVIARKVYSSNPRTEFTIEEIK